jgi:hypothetical protein
LYWVNREARHPSPLGRDTALAAELWRRSEQWVKG